MAFNEAEITRLRGQLLEFVIEQIKAGKADGSLDGALAGLRKELRDDAKDAVKAALTEAGFAGGAVKLDETVIAAIAAQVSGNLSPSQVAGERQTAARPERTRSGKGGQTHEAEDQGSGGLHIAGGNDGADDPSARETGGGSGIPYLENVDTWKLIAGLVITALVIALIYISLGGITGDIVDLDNSDAIDLPTDFDPEDTQTGTEGTGTEDGAGASEGSPPDGEPINETAGPG